MEIVGRDEEVIIEGILISFCSVVIALEKDYFSNCLNFSRYNFLLDLYSEKSWSTCETNFWGNFEFKNFIRSSLFISGCTEVSKCASNQNWNNTSIVLVVWVPGFFVEFLDWMYFLSSFLMLVQVLDEKEDQQNEWWEIFQQKRHDQWQSHLVEVVVRLKTFPKRIFLVWKVPIIKK